MRHGRLVIALHVFGETRPCETIEERDLSPAQPERDRDISVVRHERDKARRAGKRMPREEAMRPSTHHDDVRQVRLEGVDQPLKVRRDAVARIIRPYSLPDGCRCQVPAREPASTAHSPVLRLVRGAG